MAGNAMQLTTFYALLVPWP